MLILSNSIFYNYVGTEIHIAINCWKELTNNYDKILYILIRFYAKWKRFKENHISWLHLFLFRWEWDWKKNFSSQFVLITFASVIPAIFISCCFILGVMFLTSILQVIILSLRFSLFTRSIAHKLSTIYMPLINDQEWKRKVSSNCL